MMSPLLTCDAQERCACEDGALYELAYDATHWFVIPSRSLLIESIESIEEEEGSLTELNHDGASLID